MADSPANQQSNLLNKNLNVKSSKERNKAMQTSDANHVDSTLRTVSKRMKVLSLSAGLMQRGEKTSPKRKIRTGFIDLPRELRDEIYEYLLLSSRVFKIPSTSSGRVRLPRRRYYGLPYPQGEKFAHELDLRSEDEG